MCWSNARAMSNAPVHVLVHAPAPLVWELWAHPALWDTWHPEVRQARMLGPSDGGMGFLRDDERWMPFRITPINSGVAFTVETRPLPELTLVFTCTLIAVESGCVAAQSVHLEGRFSEAFEEPICDFVSARSRQALDYLRDLAEFLNEVTSSD